MIGFTVNTVTFPCVRRYLGTRLMITGFKNIHFQIVNDKYDVRLVNRICVYLFAFLAIDFSQFYTLA